MKPFLEQFQANIAQFGDAPCWRHKAASTASVRGAQAGKLAGEARQTAREFDSARSASELVPSGFAGGGGRREPPMIGGAWRTLSWRDVGALVDRLAAWLIARGLEPGDRVAIWCGTRVEWSLIDLAVLTVGGVTVPIYHTLPLDQAVFIIDEPGCRFLFLERGGDAAQLQVIAEKAPKLEGIVSLNGACGNGTPSPLACWSFAAIMAEERSVDGVAARRQTRREDDLASLVYTSGTTGLPKGVELSLGNFRAEVEGLVDVFPFAAGHECLMFLPLAHIVARALQFFQLMQGCVAIYAEGIDTIGDNIREMRPHFFAGVPRIYEKMQSKLLAQVATLPAPKRKLFHWALRIGGAVGRLQQRHQQVPLHLRLRHTLARAVFRPIHKKLGGRLVAVVSGGAPLAADVASFFHSLGILILEGYGLSETSAAVTLNGVDDFRFGTVGKPIQGVHVKIADDGEILTKGPTVFRGYFQRPEETAAVFDAQGWFRTGDIGEFSRDGFLRITDRKKDLIKTSGGKYVAPQPLEMLLKGSPLISDVMVYGDGQRFVSALVTLDADAVRHMAEAKGATGEWKALIADAVVIDAVQAVIDEANMGRASFEMIKKFRIAPTDFGVASGELTPTMKVRRTVTYERYKQLFDEMYAEPAPRSGADVDTRDTA